MFEQPLKVGDVKSYSTICKKLLIIDKQSLSFGVCSESASVYDHLS